MKALKTNNRPALSPDLVQRRASDPASSVWVGASAGTGKTKVLVDRLLRLMLPDEKGAATAPERVLCLTFTKTAAAEMSARINIVLGQWAVDSDAALSQKLENLTGRDADAALKRAARQLFARVVDAPGGMKIMTIHSFCQSVLRRFPLEAGLPPHFEVMDERTAREYLGDAQHDLILRASRDPQNSLAMAFSYITSAVNAEDMGKLLDQLATGRGKLWRIAAAHGGAENLIRDIYKTLGADPTGMPENEVVKACADTALNEKNLLYVAEKMEGAKKTVKERAPIIRQWLLSAQDERVSLFWTYFHCFIKKDFDFYEEHTDANLRKDCPEAEDILRAEAQRLMQFYERIRAAQTAQATAALLRVGLDIVESYQARKLDHALLDYDDLIEHTAALLETDSGAGWILYKLDGGLDHILVDEAQDTSPAQWRVVRTLSEEFFDGMGARADNILRTIFVVGDEKQSIFSFQGADPAEFDRMRRHFSARVGKSNGRWDPVEMNISFRSTSTVLQLVNAVYARHEVKTGVVADPAQVIEHFSHREGEAGLIELWPVIAPEKKEEAQAWPLPEVARAVQSPSARLARKIAQTVRGWLDSGEILESQNRPVRAGDIMVLVRRRTEFVDQLVRAFKDFEVPVSGVDRLVLADQIAVMDLMCLARFALLPDDDLNLATLLKTPLIGWNDDNLIQIACGRGQKTLWSQLPEGEEKSWLKNIQRRAASQTPYGFFSTVLNNACPSGGVSGRKALLSRLGYDALDTLDEFLNACLEFEQSHMPALQAFLSWFEQGQAEIKREMEQNTRDQLRIMTVHAAKGLQAPVVFLPDTVSHPQNRSNRRSGSILWPGSAKGVPLWVPRKEICNRVQIYGDAFRQEQEKADAEYRRLLYVALTRAADRLYICGWRGRNNPAENCWYEIIRRSFPKGESVGFEIEGGAVAEDEDGLPLPALRLYHPQTTSAPEKETIKKPDEIAPLPVWALHFPQAEPPVPEPLAPSRLEEPDSAVLSPLGPDQGGRFRRGNLIHRLLEFLPDIPAQNRAQAAARYMRDNARDIEEAQRSAITDEVLRILDYPEFAAVFGSGSRAEVPVTGVIGSGKKGRPLVLSGQIDRLVVTDSEILIIDYKSNRPPPRDEKDVPAAYIRQMAAYRAALQKIYPGRPVRCALLWTDGPFLTALSDARLDAAAY